MLLNIIQKTPHYFINPCNTNKNQTECLKYKENKGNTSFKSISDIPASKLGTIRTLSFGNKGTAKQDIKPEYFFIRMAGYGQNYEWANGMVKIAQEASQMISEKKDFDEILDHIAQKVHEININNKKAHYFGIKKEFPTDALEIPKEDTGSRGCEYFQIYDTLLNSPQAKFEYFRPKSNDKYKEANIAEISYCYNNQDKFLIVAFDASDKLKNLDLCKNAYDKLTSNPNPSEEEILETCATIQWLIMQELPYHRGSDSIANLITKSIMHSYNIEISPIKEGISLDFEAFDTDLDEYIQKYPEFFERYPNKRK